MPLQIYEMILDLPAEMKPWLDEAVKTDSETVSRWYGYASSPLQYPKGRASFERGTAAGVRGLLGIEDFGSKDGVMP